MSGAQFSKETFWSLLSRDTTKGIVIPIIQRAYTQGGRGNDSTIEEKSNAFLEYLVDALCSDTKKVELDFVYGTVEGGKILPLDGQQRLTTLFLLHWYIAQKENHLTDAVKSTLKQFSYETRASSRYFCKNLCDFTVPAEMQSTLSQTIENECWFVLSWENDPSVLSMLGMLDKIHIKLGGLTTNLWDKLVSDNKDKAPITFFYTPLEAFNLTDELYIKMNARGKELTRFEKFKASIEKKIDAEGWDDDKSFVDQFGSKMDNEWTDLFWKFRVPVKNKAGKVVNYKIDRRVLRFFSALLINYYAGKNEERTNSLFSDANGLALDCFDKASYTYLYKMTNLFHSAWTKLGDCSLIKNADFWWGDTRKQLKTFSDIFELFIASNNGSTMTWQQRALFYGFSQFLEFNHSLDERNLSDWLSFNRNMIANGTIDAYTPFVSAKKRIDEFSAKSCGIYTYLSTTTVTKGFASEQLKEEIQKAKIYANTPEAKPIIQEIENCNFCRGHIGFVLECLDIHDSASDIDIDSLNKMKNILFEYLNDDDISNEFRRALMTMGDNAYYTFWQSWSHIPAGYIEYGDLYAPQYCLITSKNKEKDKGDIRSFALSEKRSYLKSLLHDILNSERTLCQIIDCFKIPSDMPEWKQLLIKDVKWMDSDYSYLIIDGEYAFLRQNKKSWYPMEIKNDA
jgi:hypothetical protein